MTTDELGIVAFERDRWRKRDWVAAVISFASRHLFLPLLRLRDKARSESPLRRGLVNLLFYPSYIAAFVVWGALALLLLLVSPLLFFLARAIGENRAA